MQENWSIIKTRSKEFFINWSHSWSTDNSNTENTSATFIISTRSKKWAQNQGRSSRDKSYSEVIISITIKYPHCRTLNYTQISMVPSAESFLASLALTETSKESFFKSDITSRPDGPAKKPDILTSVLNFAYISAIEFGSAFFYLCMMTCLDHTLQ